MERVAKWLPLVLVALGVLAYAGSLEGVFLFDDFGRIVENPRIHGTRPLAWTPRVLVDVTFRLNYLAGGLKAADYHAFNLAVHLVAGLALYGVVRRTLLRPLFAGRYRTAAPWLAGAAAGIWLVHPLQTESVTYLCQRYESMMGLFFLLTLYAFVRGTEKRGRAAWLGLAIGACAAGMLTKEVMIVAPVLILLYDGVFGSAPVREWDGRRWAVHGALFATWSLAVVLRMRFASAVARASAGAVVDAVTVSPGVYLLTQMEVIVHYLRLAFVPYPLCLDYDWAPAGSVRDVLAPGTVVVCLGILTAWGLCRRRPAAYLGAWFFATLAPSSSVVPLPDLAFEHRMYLPLAGVTTLCVVGGYSLLSRRCAGGAGMRGGRRRLAAGMAAGAIAVLAVLTAGRNRDYRSEETMWRDVVRKRPGNLRACNELARILSEQGRAGEARIHYETVLRETEGRTRKLYSEDGSKRYRVANNSPAYNRFRALANLGLLAFEQGRFDEAAARYREALDIMPHSADVRGKLDQAVRGGRDGRPEER